ncbi:hypothetical protein DFP72DRAFT_1177195 [Ephemerocybe angulata]|uniref:Uncharacterized protein n=1 Tax=Ephemerocybe angulata TaxID=980116 RepID=A0A8H6HBW5_9AGAR|nr:hypothetical protein DFP72DRAFT_1177195 [Tulosesus angulatus]
MGPLEASGPILRAMYALQHKVHMLLSLDPKTHFCVPDTPLNHPHPLPNIRPTTLHIIYPIVMSTYPNNPQAEPTEPKLARKPDDRWDEVTLRENTPPPPAYIVDTLTSQRISNSHAIDDVEAQKAEAHQREGHLAREKEISRLFGGGGAGKGSEDSDDADAETLGEKNEVASRRRGWLARHWKICFCLVPLIAVCATLGALLYIRNHSPLSRRDT